MLGLRPSSFFIAVALENKFSTLHQRKMPHKGAFDFLAEREGLFHDPFWGKLHTMIKTQAASPQAFLSSKLAEASFARSENKKPTKIRGF